MEHLDLAGVITTPSSNWHLPAFEPTPFDQQDAIYLSSSRPMLEPIMEETSEDEESIQNSWSQFENNSTWSSESETGSVIRIELNRDTDSISERDFACPAKRPRRDEFLIGGLLTCQPTILDDNQLLRKFQRNDLLSSAIDKINSIETNSLTNSLNGERNSGGSNGGGHRKRFDDFYCDMDSPSCNSLSRSSSLIQFESLERQLLNEQGLCSSLGNSSPSLLSFEGGCIESGSGSGSNSNRGSTGCLKRYESSDSRLHQTYFDLDKIDFGTNLHFTSTAASKSDSESSSDTSVASHKVLSATGAAHARGFLKGGKSSAENLSEDSGYCEHIHSVMRAKSKSIPNFEKFCEEDEFYDHPVVVASVANTKTHSKIQTEDAPKIATATTKVNSNGNGAGGTSAKEQRDDDADDDDDDDVANDDEDEEHGELVGNDDDEDEGSSSNGGDCWYSGDKNSRRSPSSSSPISSDESSSAATNTSKSTSPSSCASASSFTWRPAVSVVSPPSAMATSEERTMAAPLLHRSPNRSSSLPDIRGEETAAVGHHYHQQQQQHQHYHHHNQLQEQESFERSNSTECVASVPNDLDRIEDHHRPSHRHHNHSHRQRRSAAQRRQRTALSGASSSSDLDEDQLPPRSPSFSASSSGFVVVRSNSWKRSRNSNERLDPSAAAFQSARSLQSIGSGSSGVGYMNASYSNLTLLDYSGRPRSNRNSLSLVSEECNSKRNSRCDMATVISDQETEESSAKETDEIHHVQLTIRKPPRRTNSKSSSKSINKTFDQDPTSLTTSYAQSLEKCNFDPKELSTSDLTRVPPKRRFHAANKKQRVGIVSSTPNLNAYSHEETDDDMYVSSTHTSMQQLPTTEKRMGILLPAGSRASFGSKGVSFYPVVSKYTWQEQSSEECNDTLVAPTPSDPNDENDNDATVTEESQHPTEENESKEKASEENTSNEEKRNIAKTSHSADEDEENAIKEKITITINSVVAAAAMTATNPPPIAAASAPASVSALPANNISVKSAIVERGSDCYRLSSLNNVNSHPPRLILSASHKLLSEKLLNPRPATPVPHILVQQPSCSSVDSVVTPVSVSASAPSLSKMSNYPVKCSAASGESNSLNNNNELMKSKFKADEKHPQHKGFLSRFANGFRFSLRRNKKKQQQQQKDALAAQGQLPPIAPPSSKKSVPAHQKQPNSPDFIYIPLKGPVQHPGSAAAAKSNGTPCNNNGRAPSSPSPSNTSSSNSCSNHVLNSNNNKQTSSSSSAVAPFQKPPRVVGVCEKRARQHALQNAAPQSIDEAFLDNERSYYDFKNQLNGVTNGYGCNTQQNGPTSAMNNSSSHHMGAAVVPPSGGGGAVGGGLYHYQIPPQQQQQLNHCKIGLIETNLDTHETKISGKTRSLMELGPQVKYNFSSKRNTSTSSSGGGGGVGGVSGFGDVDLDGDADDDDDGMMMGEDSGVGNKKSGGVISGGGHGAVVAARRPHKSMEFLLDKENQKNVLPPENELQKSHDNTTRLSEHQLRVQASLQRLNIPDWFRQYNLSSPKSPSDVNKSIGINSNFSRKRASDSGRWTGLNSKTTSLSSLGSQRSDRSPLLLSPSAHSHHGGQTTLSSVVNSTSAGGNFSGGSLRWSTSILNSTQTSPSVSTRGSFSRGGPINSSFISATSSAGATRSSFRQPYLGWRSQEKLSQPRTPHERLASSLLAQRSQKPEQPVTPEIQTSIKEVTSAIVHYVNDQTNRTNQRSRSASPNSRKCWLESSFVGIRPVESPQTPIIENSTFSNASTAVLNNSFHNNTTSATSSIHSSIGINNVTTDGGLRINGVGGDSASEAAHHPTRMTTSASPSSLQVVDQQARFRRRSEGDAQRQKEQQQQQLLKQQQKDLELSKNANASANNTQTASIASSSNNCHPEPPRRISLDSTESKTTSELQIKCRNTKCDQAATPVDAKKFYKSCHNCSHLYCSRECRRIAWEKHRKACLHSRASNLCRQVLSTCKDDIDTQRHLSLLARKGYLSQGRGVVRALFRSAESAEGFIKNGFQCMGEASYVRWPDLMPAEMGLELYSELLKLSTEYKPDSKMLIYVAICVVSEAPGNATATVKWERQLVSRCAKLKLCKSILTDLENSQQQIVMVPEPATEILILTFNPAKCTNPTKRGVILTNILTILSRRGVLLKKHYPEIHLRLQTYADGQTDRFNAVTLHPRDSQTGQSFVCIIMPLQSDGEIIKMPCSDSGNKVSTIDVGEELMES
ncbi:uncharacterized protein LOC129938349 isoform X2 [Eupeodes corollae]|uniref:uncharacterized protein LOC129938349 isoform X2 n=1 Tax=Eupeodes corollae TaxID=290404 RepID=UPI002492A686|nr:uncharacterized protein LOC129938349 isoform X2 [Eupeodes corollae]